MSMDTMNHEQAAGSRAVERYLLGELSPEEREAFEGHYFDCSTCFERVQSEMQLHMQFLGHARHILGPEPEKGLMARLWEDMRRPAPAFATAMLFGALGMSMYQRTEIAALKAPHLGERYMLSGEARGGARPVRWRRGDWVNLSVDVDRNTDYVAYQAQFTSPTGKTVASRPAPAGDAQGPLVVSVLAGTLEEGANTVDVYGVDAAGRRKAAGKRVEFELQFVN